MTTTLTIIAEPPDDVSNFVSDVNSEFAGLLHDGEELINESDQNNASQKAAFWDLTESDDTVSRVKEIANNYSIDHYERPTDFNRPTDAIESHNLRIRPTKQ